jgi:hypothetical protein
MKRLSPAINSRNFKDLLRHLRSMAPFYVPEWHSHEEKGPGIALAQIYLHLYEHILSRLNQVPDKNFVAFLDMLGLELQPAQSATVPVTFTLAEGSKENVLAEKGTQLTAAVTDDQGESQELIFETENNLSITSAKLLHVFSIDAVQDKIYDHSEDFGASRPFKIFTGTNLQEHSLYIGHNDLLNQERPSEIEVNFTITSGADGGGKFEFVWEYWNGNNWVNLAIFKNKIDVAAKSNIDTTKRFQKSGVFTLKKNHVGKIDEKDISGIKSRWLRCRLTNPATAAAPIKLPLINTVHIGVRPLASFALDLAFNNDFPLDFSEIEVKMLAPDNHFFSPPESPFYNKTILVESLKGYVINKGQKAILVHDSKENTGDIYIENHEYLPGELEGDAGTTRLELDIKDDDGKTITELDRPYEKGDIVKILPIIKPFGEVPRLFDTFYIASNEAFTKKGSDITLHIDAEWNEWQKWPVYSPPEEEPQPVLSWEYWNGDSWRGIRVRDNTDKFHHAGKVEFKCPDDIKAVEVNGEEMFWIRIRLIDGDFGKEIILEDGSDGDVEAKKGHFYYPIIKELKINYEDIEREPEVCLGANNLNFIDHTQECNAFDQTFMPFRALPEQFRGLFLGFDKQLTGGPLRILFTVQEQTLPRDSQLKIQWYLGSGEKWQELNVEDDTDYLTKNGTLTFTGSRELEQTELFGKKNLFWLKGSIVKEAHSEYPQIRGIFPNTVTAFQAAAVENEILGFSDGTADQEFGLLKFPIISQKVWVNESSEPDEENRKVIISEEGEDAVKVEKDETGEVTAVWIRWHAVEDLVESTDRSRHYMVDLRTGTIKFGDGVNGMVPPPGANNIKADYKFGGGKVGNVAAKTITDLKGAIPFVDGVINHVAADGGSETETLEQVLVRGPQKIKHRQRAVAVEDFEALAKEAARIVARAKCLQNLDAEGKYASGWVTVIIIPQSDDRVPKPSRQLVKAVKQKLGGYSANTVSTPGHIHVRGPEYAEVLVETNVTPVSLDEASPVEGRIREELERFIHPLTGGPDRSGWPFGKSICRSEIFARLEGIEGVEFVKSIRLFQDGIQQLGDLKLDEFTLPISGEHRIEVRPREKPALSEEKWTASECADEV